MKTLFQKTFEYEDLSDAEIGQLCRRGSVISEDILNTVRGISHDILSYGDAAVCHYTKKFDGIDVTQARVTQKEVDVAREKCLKMPNFEALREAILVAKANIEAFHSKQIPSNFSIETFPGMTCAYEFSPLERVGLYIPGGTAPLFSTVLMLAIPAKLAGCAQIALSTPCNAFGEINHVTLFVADLLGITEIYKIGGAQAIFAMAYGTGSIPKVQKIFGPGNRYVTAAKMLVGTSSQHCTAIDMPDGPSEVLVIGNETSNAKFIAADLLSQCEHDTSSIGVFVCTSREKIEEVCQEVDALMATIPRKEIAQMALKNSFVVLTKNIDNAIEFSNKFAPEHLILGFDSHAKYRKSVRNAGSVFCGKYTCESFGDYASGTNHVLPTSGFAASFSGVSVLSFGKFTSYQEVTREGLRNLGSKICIMAEAEGLMAHSLAVSIRMSSKF